MPPGPETARNGIGVSLVVCTRNRLSSLRLALGAIQELSSREPWELIVVDNGSTDGTGDWLATLRGIGAPMITVTERRKGLSRARNAGLRHARGRIIAFTDDDCYPTSTYLNDLLDEFADESLGYVGGRVLLYDPEDLPITIKTSAVPEEIPPYTWIPAGQIHGANMAFRRDVCQSVGFFDLNLGAGTETRSAEDTDYICRASMSGWRGRYSPGPTVHHHHGRRGERAKRDLIRGYDLGRGAYYAKSLVRHKAKSQVMKYWYWETRAAASPKRLFHQALGALIYIGKSIPLPGRPPP